MSDSKKDKKNNIKDTENFDDIENLTYDEEIDSDKFDSKISKIKKELKKCQAEKQEYLDGWQRSKADYINLKKRTEEEKNRIRDYGSENIIIELLPVIDNFEMAFKDEESWNKAPENWRVGIEFIYNNLIKTLENNGVKQIDPVGEKFDPEQHHSIETVEVNNKNDDGKIISVQQKGYSLKDKNIRPAIVKVGEFKD